MLENDIAEVVEGSKGYSCADINHLCAEASMIPIREIKDITNMKQEDIRPICLSDFKKAFTLVKSSVAKKDLL